MPDNIPQDDDITKTALWKRIDDVRGTIDNINEQLQKRMTDLATIVSTGVSQRLEDNKIFITNYDNTLDSKLNTFTLSIQKIISDAVDALTKQNQLNIKALEEKLRVLQGSITGIVVAETKSTLNPTNEKVANLAKDLETFKISLLTTVGKYGTESNSKITDLSKRLEETLSKIRKLATTIS